MRYSVIRVVLVAAIAGSALAAPAYAAVPPQTVQEFINQPSGLLSPYPNGGPEMVQAVQDLLTSDPNALDAVLGLLQLPSNQINAAQSTAIGTALGRYALAIVDSDQAGAVRVQDLVVQSRNIIAMEAFDVVVAGNQKLTAASTGTGGGAETSTNPGGGGISGGGPIFGGLTTSHGNVPDSFTTTFVGGPSGSPPGSGPVSP
jgi:hypothetical protein